MSVEWMVIRGSGIAAFAALSATTIWGLLVSSKIVTGKVFKAKALTWFHESLAIVALLATIVHVAVLSVHEYLEFSWIEILVPGASDWRKGAVAFGVVALYGLVIVAGSFYFKKRIGQKTWRLIHFSGLGVFTASLLHGVTAGSDTGTPLMMGLYIGSALVVGGLVMARLKREGSNVPEQSPGPKQTIPGHLGSDRQATASGAQPAADPSS